MLRDPMASKRLASAQPRRARTVRRLRLGQRPPHSARRGTPVSEAPPPEAPPAEAPAAPPDGSADEACVRRAIEAHLDFAAGLRAAVGGRGELEVKAVLAHDRSPLGAWLRGEGQRFSPSPLFAEVQLWHRRFHAAAAVVAIRAASGRSFEAAKLLEGPSYQSTSANLLSALEDLLRS